MPLAAPGCAFVLGIIKGKALLAPNAKGKPEIKDKPGALTAVCQVRILLRELKKSCKLPFLRVNAPLLGVLRVFRKDFDKHASLQYLSDPPDQQD